jgi:hypothetical protein
MIHVTRHAAERFLERVDGRLTLAEAIEALSSPAIQRAAQFGAPCVRLGTGQRVVLEGWHVVTVLPADLSPGRLDPRRTCEMNKLEIGRRNT